MQKRVTLGADVKTAPSSEHEEFSGAILNINLRATHDRKADSKTYTELSYLKIIIGTNGAGKQMFKIASSGFAFEDKQFDKTEDLYKSFLKMDAIH